MFGHICISRSFVEHFYKYIFNLILHYKRSCKINIQKYQKKLSGPIIDRIDLNIEVAEINYSELHKELKEESSDEIRMILPKVYEVGPQFLWVLSELVRPLKSDNELKTMFGVDQKAYSQFMMGIENVDGATFKSFYEALSDDKKPIADAIVAMSKKFGLYSADLAVLDQWGKTADGRLVILDTGITTKDFAEY